MANTALRLLLGFSIVAVLLLSGCGTTGSANNNVAPPGPLAIVTASLPAGVAGVPYSATLIASGGTSPYTWTATGLPAGIALSSSGSLKGTPSASGTSTVALSVSDNSSHSVKSSLTLTVTSLSSTPALPQASVDTSYAQAPCTVTINTGGDLQAAIDSANPGNTICLTAGATFTGNYFLRYKSGFDTNTNYIVIRTTTPDASMPQGTRVSPSSASLMAKVISPNTVPAFQTEFSAHHYRLIGLEITKVNDPTSTTYGDLSYGLIFVGSINSSNQLPSQPSQVPHHIVTDRCYLHGDYNATRGETYVGETMNGNYVAVVDSYIANIHSPSIEVQGVQSYNANGPLKIVNNYIEAAGENIIFGGEDPALANSTPSDIEIRHNFLSKPLSWNPNDPSYAGVSYSVKNLLEMKNAQRVLVDGNVMQHNWVKAQSGVAVLFTPRNQSGTCNWCTVQDVTFTNNVVAHSAGAINTLAADSNYPSGQLQRVLVRNNLFLDIGGTEWGDTGGYSIFLSLDGSAWPGGPQYTELNVAFDHNTEFASYAAISMAGPPAATNFTFTNNIAPHGSYGIFGNTIGEGTTGMTAYLLNPTFTDNVMVGSAASFASLYPLSPAFLWANTTSDVGFSDNSNCNSGTYSLTACALLPSSPYHGAASDGTDIGVDINALASETVCVMAGAQCP